MVSIDDHRNPIQLLAHWKECLRLHSEADEQLRAAKGNYDRAVAELGERLLPSRVKPNQEASVLAWIDGALVECVRHARMGVTVGTGEKIRTGWSYSFTVLEERK